MDYLELLTRLHEALQPRTYLEIGVEFGPSLALSRSPSIGIDPFPQPTAQALCGKPWVKIYRGAQAMISSPRTKRRRRWGLPLDLAFIDGLHTFTQVARDLENVQRWGRPGTVAVIHDVLPGDAWQASHEFHDGMWTGDVWRIFPFLQEHRPDLHSQLVDATPTGVVIVSRLDPHHSGMAALAEAIDRASPGDGPEYDAIVNAFLARARPETPEFALQSLRGAAANGAAVRTGS